MGRVILTACGLALALGACATERQWLYSNPKVSSAEFDRDREECLRRAVDATGRPVRLTPITFDRARFNACMMARGYTVEHAPRR